jgi:DNA repair protein RecN (Recombination protein N)
VIPEAESCADQLDDMLYRVRDIAEQVRTWSDDDVADPTARLDAIESRLDAISRLQRKYGETVDDVLAFRDRAVSQLQTLEGAQERLDELNRREDKLNKTCRAFAATVTERRLEIAKRLTQRIQSELEFLDMPKVRFSVSVQRSSELLPTGADDVEFLIATNPGEPLMPMIKIASGGELSRLMLAVKSVINDRDGVGTVVFDEVDTGISGKTSRKVGIRLRQMGQTAQVICITHAAQIASLADTHLLITKEQMGERVQTKIQQLDENGRIDEIARILGGLEVTPAQRQAAKDMIAERYSF